MIIFIYYFQEEVDEEKDVKKENGNASHRPENGGGGSEEEEDAKGEFEIKKKGDGVLAKRKYRSGKREAKNFNRSLNGPHWRE